MPDSSVPITAGTGTSIDTWTVGTEHRQIVLIGDKGGYHGRVSSFRTLGRAATTQNLFAIHNATGSTVRVDIHKLTIDVLNAAATPVAMTVIPPIFRVWRFTALPTGGTALTKVAEDTALSSSSSVTVWGDASADGTNSGTALTLTLPAGNIITQEYSPRIIYTTGTATAAPIYEPADRMEFLAGFSESITLRALEGVSVSLSAATTAANPATNHYIVTCAWEEFTP